MYHLPGEILDQIFTYYEESGDVSSSDWSILTQVSKSFHARFVPLLFDTISEEQLRHPSFAEILQQKPQYSAFVRNVAWQLIPFDEDDDDTAPEDDDTASEDDDTALEDHDTASEDDDTASETAFQAEVERLIALLSQFSRLRSLHIMAGDETMAAESQSVLTLLPSVAQLLNLRPKQLQNLVFSSPAFRYRMTEAMWDVLHWFIETGHVSMLHIDKVDFINFPTELDWSSIKTLRIRNPYRSWISDIVIGQLLSSCRGIDHFDFSFDEFPKDIGWFLRTCLPDRGLRKLTLASIYLVENPPNVTSLLSRLPALEEVKLICYPADLNGNRNRSEAPAKVLQDNLLAIFPSLHIHSSNSLKILQLHYQTRVEDFYVDNFSSRVFGRFLDRALYPALSQLCFTCQYAEDDGQEEDGQEETPSSWHGEAVDVIKRLGDWKSDFASLVSTAPIGLTVEHYLGGNPRTCWAVRWSCIDGGDMEEEYR